jgi:hypothetical protein
MVRRVEKSEEEKGGSRECKEYECTANQDGEWMTRAERVCPHLTAMLRSHSGNESGGMRITMTRRAYPSVRGCL